MASNQVSNQPFVLVLDDTQTRATEITAAFAAAGARSLWLTRSQGKFKVTPHGSHSEWIQDNSKGSLPSKPDLVMIHVRDAALLEVISTQLQVDAANVKRIYYGGRGGLDPDMPVAEERIWRSVTNESGIPTNSEARVILNHVLLGAEKPAILRQPKSFPFLRALGMACVGYLAVEAAQRYSAPGSPANISEAYRQLGWFALPERERNELTKSAGGLLSRWEEVHGSAWWRQFLLAGAGSVEAIQPTLNRELSEAKTYGLGESTAVSELVKELVHDTDVRPPKPESVELAFQDLARLEQW